MSAAAGDTRHHLAEINVARGHATLDDPRMAGFVAALAEMNAVAEASPGFVWRLIGDGDDATSIRAFDDPRVLVNMSAWESIDALFAFTYRSGHTQVYRRRADWFERPGEASMALWWVPAGERPMVTDGLARLDHLRRHGPTPHAFTFRKRFPAPEPTADVCA